MPLTEQEREWLERRKNLCGRCGRRKYCRTGNRHGFNTEICRHWELTAPNVSRWGSYRNDYEDAARFDALVSRELTNPVGEYMPLCTPEDCDFRKRHNCRECRLMHARIAVESEMEKEKTR